MKTKENRVKMTLDDHEKFIQEVAKYAIAETSARDKWILPSVCIAQAILESGWDLKCTTLFGIKSTNVNDSGEYITSEYINGKWVTIKDRFVEFKNIADAIHHYYDFLTTTSRYEKCLNNTDYTNVTYSLIHTTDGLPYATAPNYDLILNNLIEDYDLTRFDFTINNETDFKIGDEVRFDYVFYTSEDDIPLTPLKYTGFITNIREGARNPYLINNGDIGWCNAMYMTLINRVELNVGDDVVVVNPIDINGNKIKLYYEYYKIMEVSENDVVIGYDDVVTCRIKKEYVRRY